MVGISHDDVIEDFDLEQLARSNEVTGDFNVRFGWGWFAARMIVLCGAPVYVQLAIGGNDVDSFGRDSEARIYLHGRMRY